MKSSPVAAQRRRPTLGSRGMRPWQSRTVAISGGYLAYHRTGGPGPVLVLSHGLTDNGLCWSRFAAAMESDFDIVMLDARGHGESSRLPASEPHDSGQDIAEAIDRLALHSPVVMGHSVGARATAAYASAHPGRASMVILEDPPFTLPAELSAAQARSERFRQQVEKFRSMTPAEITAMGRASSPNWHEDEFPAWAAAKQQVAPDAMPSYAASWQDSVAGITAPTLLIYGEPGLGGMITPALANEATAINSNIRPVQISGAGHNVRRENFLAFLLAVRAFLLG